MIASPSFRMRLFLFCSKTTNPKGSNCKQSADKMVNFSDIAVFVLATTRKNGRYKQDYVTYFESRIIPIRETWGQYFPSLYFVFGTNKFDEEFLTQQCETDNKNRQLAAKDKQVPQEDRLDLYSCPIYPIEAQYKHIARNEPSATTTTQQPNLFTFNAIWTGNCTGEYFGYGPTCRCQESMRYFNSHPSLQSKEWFIFMDDDIYYRPYALLSMLNGLTNGRTDDPAALVASSKYRAFQFSKSGPKEESTGSSHKCVGSPAYDFAIAQPAMVNRAAMERMRNGIDANALTGLQGIWGGTHDALLGMLFWMYQIPTSAFNSSYVGGGLHMVNDVLVMPRGKSGQEGIQRETHFIFHRLSNFRAYTWLQAEKKNQLKTTYPSIYDVVKYFGEEALYTSPHAATCMRTLDTCPDKTVRALGVEQVAVGERGWRALTKLQPSGVEKTVFAAKARAIEKQYEHFLPSHCQLL